MIFDFYYTKEIDAESLEEAIKKSKKIKYKLTSIEPREEQQLEQLPCIGFGIEDDEEE